MKLPPAETWQRINTVLAETLDRPSGERASFLDAACAGEPQMRREVRALLDAERTAPGFLDDDVFDFALPLLPDLPPGLAEASAVEGRRVGPYRLLRELGRGGMSTVFLVERTGASFEQHVAVKLLPPALSSDALVRRFEQEQQIMASLAHPHIAKLLGGGVTEEGQPYFALEYVDGRPIDAYCRDEDCSVDERLALFAEVGRAVQHAHRNLVVHRDLKPSNILITGEGVPKLLDFGIAKLLADHDLPATPLRTRTGARWLTLPYAAPEQVRGEPVTTETDVYQLGAVLYELLAGRRPFHDEEEQDRSRRVLEGAVLERPPPPSTAADEATEKALRGDLDRILLKALRKEPERRYRSVEALVEDIERHRNGQPVQARAGTWARCPGYAGVHAPRRRQIRGSGVPLPHGAPQGA